MFKLCSGSPSFVSQYITVSVLSERLPFESFSQADMRCCAASCVLISVACEGFGAAAAGGGIAGDWGLEFMLSMKFSLLEMTVYAIFMDFVCNNLIFRKH